MAESKETLHQRLFINLVISLQTAALQQMGKLINPITQKVERDLEQARMSIDMLAMLQAKTQGNLDDDEKRLLDHLLFELRMNYVEEANKPRPEKTDSTEQAAASEQTAQTTQEQAVEEGEKE